MTEEQQQTLPTVIERASIALGAAEHEQRLVELSKASTGIVAITNAAGYQECHSARMALKRARVEIERLGKDAREDAQAFAKAIIAEERRLVGIIQPEESRLQAIQEAHDAIVEAERAKRERIERERVTAIVQRINWLRDLPVQVVGKSAAEIAQTITNLQSLPITAELYAEFLAEANETRVESLRRLGEMHAAGLGQEAERVKLAEERAALERDQAAERARQAEARRTAENERAELDRQKREQDARERAQREEQQRLDAQRAQQEAEVQRQRDASARAAQRRERIKAARYSSADEALYAIATVCENVDVPDALARADILVICEANLPERAKAAA